MSLSSLIDVVAKLSPIVGTALGGPVGGIVTALLSSFFGAKDIPTLLANIQNDPEREIKIKEIEEQIQANNLGDIQSARARDEKIVEMAAAPNANFVVSFIALVPHILAFMVGGAIFSIAMMRMFYIDETNDTLLAVIISQLFIIFIKQCSMYFGDGKKDS